MLKQQSTLSEENFTFCSDGSSNQHKLLQLVRNLELELGYHSIALKKAQEMISIVTNDNTALKKENEILKSKCKKLELQNIKFENEMNRGQFSYSCKNIQAISPTLKSKSKVLQAKIDPFEVNPKNNLFGTLQNRMNNYSVPETPLLKKKSQLSKQNENDLENLLEDRLETSPTKNNKPKNSHQIYFDAERRNKKEKNKKECLSPNRQYQTLSFIPFEELSIKTQWG